MGRDQIGHYQFHKKLSVKAAHFSLARPSGLRSLPQIKRTHRRPLVIPPRFDTDIIKVSSTSHLHEQNSHASFTCPCMHGIRPFGLALDT